VVPDRKPGHLLNQAGPAELLDSNMRAPIPHKLETRAIALARINGLLVLVVHGQNSPAEANRSTGQNENLSGTCPGSYDIEVSMATGTNELPSNRFGR
jgi:hypothetical protein